MGFSGIRRTRRAIKGSCWNLLALIGDTSSALQNNEGPPLTDTYTSCVSFYVHFDGLRNSTFLFT